MNIIETTKDHLIISLIKDDLIHSRLINGLNILGLDASPYFLHLSDLIFQLMGLDDKSNNEELYQEYLKLAKKTSMIEVEDDEALSKLALEIYIRLRQALLIND